MLSSKEIAMHRARLSAALLLPLIATVASGDSDTQGLKAPPTQRNFVACPVVMDTLDVPCWVAEYQGERYYLTVQTGRGGGSERYPFSPMVRHRVLVEGTVSDEPRICGGIVLREAKLSPLEDVEAECGKVVPGEGYRTKGPRPLGPDGDPPGPRETTAVNYRTGVVTREQRDKAYRDQVAARQPMEFQVMYFFDSNYLPFPLEQRVVDDAAKYATDIKASRIEIVGYRGATILSNGQQVTEKQGLAEARAKKIADIFAFFAVPRDNTAVSWKEEPEHAGGVRDFERRRATIKVIP
jgi:outer membrane protein OmpA-like peptidoglycan-associated protein